MIDYGAGPTNDEVEVVVFGPGYGEAVAVHLSNGNWILADSCLDPIMKKPASLAYLEAIGVSASSVKAIIATHWHDDHVRGISILAEKCCNAEFHFSGAFNNKEAAALLAAYSNVVSPSLSRGTSELFTVVKNKQEVFHLHHRSNVFESSMANGNCARVTALSPSQAAITQSISNMAQYLSTANSTHGNIVALKPNLEAVVLHIDLGGDAILLGSDLEDAGGYGWTAIIGDTWSSSRTRSSVYKIAHHGSHTGDSDLIWSQMLFQGSVYAAMTPFNNGSQRLPTEADRSRIKDRTNNAYITSRSGYRPTIDSTAVKRLGDVVKNLSTVNNGFGAVRIRKKLDSSDWAVSCFGDAHHL